MQGKISDVGGGTRRRNAQSKEGRKEGRDASLEATEGQRKDAAAGGAEGSRGPGDGNEKRRCGWSALLRCVTGSGTAAGARPCAMAQTTGALALGLRV